MAAYAALVSLMNLIEQIQHHPSPPISLHQRQVESLTEKIAFLQDFLEAYNTCDGDQEVDRLRSRIADAAYTAEDVIESYVVHQIQARCTSTHRGKDISSVDLFQVQHQYNNDEKKKKMKKRLQDLKRYFVTKFHPQSTSHGGNTSHAESDQNLKKAADDVIDSHVLDKTVAESITHEGEKISFVDLYEGLHKVIRDMDFITKGVLEIKDKMGTQDRLHIMTAHVASSSSPSTKQNTMVGFNDVLYEVLDKLTGQQSHRQIISISGMGGIGKTTLARNVYTNPLIEQHFDVLAWVTISQEFNIPEILLEILLCLKNQGRKESLSEKGEQDLGLQLHKCLSGRRYLIIMDDMWSVEAWDKVKFYFPDNNNGSRIVITTRMSKLAQNLDGTIGLEMSFLDVDESWDLFCKTVFGEQGCPDELEKIGKRIAENCKGLPLSIVVIGGLLAKSKQTRERWEYIAENLNSIVNLDDNERCLKLLLTSYNQLPIHLKPCFLYMGSLPEDGKIDISKLIKQWVAEGFLKPHKTKSLEDTAGEYLTDLIERNLILVSDRELSGKPIFCKIHDLLRDLCLREGHKDKFLYVTSQHGLNIIPQDISTQRRIAILESTSTKEYRPQVLHALESASLARSLIYFQGSFPSLDFRLLRVLKAVSSSIRSCSMADIFQLINSRYLDVTGYWDQRFSFSSSFYLIWNLQTLILGSNSRITIPQSEFCMMRQLRHVQVEKLYLRNLGSDLMDKQDDSVMENLQTLLTVYNFRLSEEVAKRIPNVKELEINYSIYRVEVASYYCLNNLDRLHKLEYLKCSFHGLKGQNPYYSQNNMSFPNSLKELFLFSWSLAWEDVNIKIGSLPFLQKLTLQNLYFTSSKWETVEEHFTSLKYLMIDYCSNLEDWTTESTHFPRLEYLHIWGLEELMEIPSDIGEIPTLKLIKLDYCSDSAVISAKRIAEEQEENGNEDLQVRVTIISKDSELTENELVSNRNFHVKFW